MDLGFGTEYEKFVLRRIAANLVNTLAIRSVCQYPANALLGRGSDIFEKSFATQSYSEYPQDPVRKYDLVWNFCELEKTDNPSQLLTKMLNLSRSYVFIITQNNRNIGVHLHRLYHLLGGRPWDHGRVSHMSLATIEEVVRHSERKCKVVRRGYFDAPWFILDIYEAGTFLRKLVPESAIGTNDMRQSRFESYPDRTKSWLAHHCYALIKC